MYWFRVRAYKTGAGDEGGASVHMCDTSKCRPGVGGSSELMGAEVLSGAGRRQGLGLPPASCLSEDMEGGASLKDAATT